MELIKLSFVEADGMLNQVIRPYDLDQRGSAIDLFSKATEKGFNISAKRLAAVAAPLMGPSTRRKIDAHISNGWDAPRIMFAMVIATGNRANSKEYHYIVGHTDESMHTVRGTNVRFEKRMKLYFNNITRIHMTEATYMTRDRGHRSLWQPKIITHDQVLNRSAIEGFNGGRREHRNRAMSLRPTDLFTRQGGETAFGAYLTDKDVPVKNLCGVFSGQLRSSTRENNSSTNFMRRSLNAFVSSAADPQSAFIDDNHDHETMQRTIDSVIENSIDADPYIEQIRRDSNILEQGYITFGELMDMNPDFDEDSQLPFIPLDRNNRNRIVDNIVGFKSDENESIAAAMIAHSLPGILINSMYSSVDNLTITTRARVGENKLQSAFPHPFVEGMSIAASWPYFEDQIENILIQEVSKGGQFEFDARIDANIDQMIKIWIRMDGAPEAYFEFPAFCDSLLSPMLEDNMKSFEDLSKGIVDLAGDLSRQRLRSSPSAVVEPVILTATESMRNTRTDGIDRGASQPRASSRTDRSW